MNTQLHIQQLEPNALRQLCLEAGADDVGFVGIERRELSDERARALAALPGTRTFVSFVVRMNRAPIQSPSRASSNLEFHRVGEEINAVGARIVAALERRGVRALNPAMGFPMDMEHFPERMWTVAHKTVAEAAGLGRMGIHRNLIHPRLGNFVLLGTVLVAGEVAEEAEPLDFAPCLTCKLCVAACPVGAVKPDGGFDFSACYTHNYREFMSGFGDWVETVAESRSAADYRSRVSDPETVSMWQSLSFGPNYKAAYCMAVCPAGEDVITPFRSDRKAYLDEVVRPLQDKEELVYVTPGSDAEGHVTRRFPHKRVRRVSNGLRPRTVRGFLGALPLVFQRDAAKGLTARWHFRFTGEERVAATVAVADGAMTVEDGLVGTADLRITAEPRTWLGFLAGDRSLVWALLRGRVRLRGSFRRLLDFARCFPR